MPERLLRGQQVLPHGLLQVRPRELSFEAAGKQGLLPRPDYRAVIGVVREARLGGGVCEDGVGHDHAGVGHESEWKGPDHGFHVVIESGWCRCCEQQFERFVGVDDRHGLAGGVE